MVCYWLSKNIIVKYQKRNIKFVKQQKDIIPRGLVTQLNSKHIQSIK